MDRNILLNLEKYKDILPCSNKHETQQGTSFICLFSDCPQKSNQLICFECLLNFHRDHIIQCVHLDFTLTFLDMGIKILKKTTDIYSCRKLSEEELIFKRYFTKQSQLLIRAKKHLLKGVKAITQHIDAIQFAFNVFSYQKQFIMGYEQLNDKVQLINTLQSINLEHQSIYQEEVQIKAQIFAQFQLYNEAITCSEKFLDNDINSQMLNLKGYCLHMLDRIEEAEEIYEVSHINDPTNSQLLSLIVLLMESQKDLKFKNFDLAYSSVSKNVIDSLIAKQMVIEKQYQKAIQLLDKCILSNPNNYQALTFKGYCLFFQDNFKEAKDYCQKALKIYPKYYAAIILKFKLRKLENRQNEVQELIYLRFKRLIIASIVKGDLTFFQNENEYQSLKKFLISKKQEYANEELVEDCNDLNSLLKKGMEVQRQLKWNEALIIFEKGISLDFENEQFWKQKIITQYMKNDLKEVEESIQTYCSINPSSKEMRMLKNQLFWFKQVENKKLLELWKPIPFTKQYIDQQYQKGLAYLIDEHYNYALDIYSAIVKIDPDFLEAKLKMIFCLIFYNQIDQAKIQLEQILSTEKNCVQALQLKGIALYKDQNYNQALQTFKLVEEKDPNFVFVKFYQGHCYYKLKEFKKAKEIYQALMQKTTNASLQRKSYAIRFFKTVYALKFEDENYKNYLIEEFPIFANDLQAQQNQTILSFILWTWLIKKDCFPYDMSFITEMAKIGQIYGFTKAVFLIIGELFLKINDMNSAMEAFEELLRLYPNYVLGFIGKAYVLIRMNRLAEAKEYQERALKISPEAFSKYYQNDLLLHEMEILERQMFIPELYSIQEELFNQINLYF